jgi:hypothetical protein
MLQTLSSPLLGQQATFSDASRDFELNVRNRAANPAAGGQKRPMAPMG